LALTFSNISLSLTMSLLQVIEHKKLCADVQALTMSRKHRMDCSEGPVLPSEIPEGTGKCVPTMQKMTNTDRTICGPFRQRPPEKVTSEITFQLPPVDITQLKTRLYFTAPHQVPNNRIAQSLCVKRPTPSQRRMDKISNVPPLEPLVCNAIVKLVSHKRQIEFYFNYNHYK